MYNEQKQEKNADGTNLGNTNTSDGSNIITQEVDGIIGNCVRAVGSLQRAEERLGLESNDDGDQSRDL
jgi:hypothetical protein